MKQVLVTAGVIGKGGRFLMAQRLPQGAEGGKWEFPGGKVEYGEDPRYGLQRELLEELGIQVAVGRILDVISTIEEARQLVLLYFECRITQGEPAPLQSQAVGWLTPEEIIALEKPDSDERFWRKWSHSSASV